MSDLASAQQLRCGPCQFPHCQQGVRSASRPGGKENSAKIRPELVLVRPTALSAAPPWWVCVALAHAPPPAPPVAGGAHGCWASSGPGVRPRRGVEGGARGPSPPPPMGGASCAWRVRPFPPILTPPSPSSFPSLALALAPKVAYSARAFPRQAVGKGEATGKLAPPPIW